MSWTFVSAGARSRHHVSDQIFLQYRTIYSDLLSSDSRRSYIPRLKHTRLTLSYHDLGTSLIKASVGLPRDLSCRSHPCALGARHRRRCISNRSSSGHWAQNLARVATWTSVTYTTLSAPDDKPCIKNMGPNFSAYLPSCAVTSLRPFPSIRDPIVSLSSTSSGTRLRPGY